MRCLRYYLRRTPFCFGQRRKAHIQDVVSLILLYCPISQANGLMRWATPRSSRLVLKLKRPSRLPATSPVHLSHAPHSPKPCLPTPDIPRRRLDITHCRSVPCTNGESWFTVPLAWGWRREWDSNPRYGFPYTRFPSVRLQPLGHPSAPGDGRNIATGLPLTTKRRPEEGQAASAVGPSPGRTAHGTFRGLSRWICGPGCGGQRRRHRTRTLRWLLGIATMIVVTGPFDGLRGEQFSSDAL